MLWRQRGKRERFPLRFLDKSDSVEFTREKCIYVRAKPEGRQDARNEIEIAEN